MSVYIENRYADISEADAFVIFFSGFRAHPVSVASTWRHLFSVIFYINVDVPLLSFLAFLTKIYK